jgi:hypothetical protein
MQSPPPPLECTTSVLFHIQRYRPVCIVWDIDSIVKQAVQERNSWAIEFHVLARFKVEFMYHESTIQY